MDKISIVMPAFNSSNTIREAIESVINQTYENFELIVTDDSSTDDTLDIVKEYSEIDNRIICLTNKNPKGVSNARNNSIAHAKGTYIAFLDSDDYWHNKKLEKQISLMKETNSLVSHCSYFRVDKNGNEISSIISDTVVSFKDMLNFNQIANLTGIYNCNVLGKFYQKNIGHEDYEMWLRVLRETNSIGVSEKLAFYRVVGDSLSSNKFKSAGWHYKILRDELGLNKIKSLYYFTNYIINGINKNFFKV